MSPLLYDLTDGVATVTLNRPQARNALNREMALALDRVFQDMRRDAAVRAVVLTGADGHFSAGGDLRESAGLGPRTAEQRRQDMTCYQPLVRSMLGLDRPVIAAVDGVAFGAGFSLALLSDLVVASTQARFCMAFHRVGLVPDCGAWYTLPRLVGMMRARELIYSAREVEAVEAERLGLVLEVVAPAQLAERARALAHSLAQASPVALALSKQGLRASLGSDLETVLEMEASGQALAGSSAWTQEAMQRFAAREPSRFQWPARSLQP